MDSKAWEKNDNKNVVQRMNVRKEITYAEDDGGCGGELGDLDHGENLGHLTVARARVEQPGGGQQDPVHT